MVIRQLQFEEIGKARAESANRSLAEYGKRRFPEYFAEHTDAALLAEAGTIRSRAQGHDFQREDLVCSFLDLTIMYGPEFVNEPWAEPFLADASLMPEGRMDSILRHLRESGVEI